MVMTETKNLVSILKSNNGDTDKGHHVGSFPRSIKKRIQALKKLQLEGINIEAKFYERVHQLEKEFAPIFDALHAKRKAIVAGEREPTDEEAAYPILHGLTVEEANKLDSETAPEPAEGTKGIHCFWLVVLRNSESVGDMIQPHDEPILEHLIDITVEVTTNPDAYTLVFHFTPNEYFKQTELRKWYALQLTPDVDDPFDYDGPIVLEAKGTTIEWNEGKNVTRKAIKKKQRKGDAAGRFVTKIVREDSFFNFFDPPTVKTRYERNEDDEIDEGGQELLRADFEIGQMIRDNIIPRAVLYYTGEAGDDDDYFFDDMEGLEDEDISEGSHSDED